MLIHLIPLLYHRSKEDQVLSKDKGNSVELTQGHVDKRLFLAERIPKQSITTIFWKKSQKIHKKI